MVISTTSSYVYLRLRVCMGDVPEDGLVPILPVRSVSKTTSADDDVHPQVRRSLLRVKFRAASTCERLHGEVVGAGSPAPRIWDRCVRAGCPRQLHRSRGTLLPRAPRSLRSVFPCPRTLLRLQYDTERVCWSRPKACSGSC